MPTLSCYSTTLHDLKTEKPTNFVPHMTLSMTCRTRFEDQLGEVASPRTVSIYAGSRDQSLSKALLANVAENLRI